MGEKLDRLIVKLGWVGPYMREGEPVVKYWRNVVNADRAARAASVSAHTAKIEEYERASLQRVQDAVADARARDASLTRNERLAELNNDPYFSGDNDWGRSEFEWPNWEGEVPSPDVMRKTFGNNSVTVGVAPDGSAYTWKHEKISLLRPEWRVVDEGRETTIGDLYNRVTRIPGFGGGMSVLDMFS